MTTSRMTKIGLARESSWGSANAPQVALPVEPPSITEPYEQILDNLRRGLYAADYAAYQGAGHIEMSLAGHFTPEEIGFLILAMMGDVSSGTSVPYQHDFTMSSTQPDSLAIQDEGAVYASGTKRRFTGMLPSSLTFSFSTAEGVLAWSSDLMGKQGTAPGAGDIPSVVGTSPFLGWQGALTIGAANTRMIDCELTLEREVEVRHGSENSQFAVAGYSGALMVTASMTFDAIDNTELNYVLDHDTNTVVLTFSYGTANALRSVEFTMTNFNWGDGPAELDRSGIFITLGVTGRALYNTTDGGPIKIVLKNARSNYTVA